MAAVGRGGTLRRVNAVRGPLGPAPPPQDHGKTCLVATGLTLLFGALTAGIFAAGPPARTTDPLFYAAASVAGFAFLAGQGSAVTGFLAMKQKSNVLYVIPALIGGAVGLSAFAGLMIFSMYLGVQSNPLFR